MYNIYTYLKVKKNKEAALITTDNYNKELKKKSKNKNINYRKNFKNQCIYCKREKHAEKKYWKQYSEKNFFKKNKKNNSNTDNSANNANASENNK